MPSKAALPLSACVLELIKHAGINSEWLKSLLVICEAAIGKEPHFSEQGTMMLATSWTNTLRPVPAFGLGKMLLIPSGCSSVIVGQFWVFFSALGCCVRAKF
jgi:hypothetical protein